MSADIEAIARAWMAHQGYTPDDIEVAETDTHEASGCEWCPNHMAWECFDPETNQSRHPAWDDLRDACEMANVAIEALEATHTIVPKPVTEVAKGFDFTGCSSRDVHNCNCETWAPTECDKCGKEIEDGQEIYTLTRVENPALPDDDRDQDWQVFVWHENCATATSEVSS